MEKGPRLKKVVKKVPMSDLYSQQRLDQGLCSCCKGASTCTYPKTSGRPILECDEFDGILAPPLGLVHPRNVAPMDPAHQANPRGSDFKEYRGLCSNCEQRSTCTYPKLEGGVWHCEEYE